jgi:hypothetical protein
MVLPILVQPCHCKHWLEKSLCSTDLAEIVPRRIELSFLQFSLSNNCHLVDSNVYPISQIRRIQRDILRKATADCIVITRQLLRFSNTHLFFIVVLSIGYQDVGGKGIKYKFPDLSGIYSNYGTEKVLAPNT